MQTFWTVLIVLLIIAAVILFLLYHFGQKLQMRQAESQKAIETYSQNVSLLVIDKKKMKLKEAPHLLKLPAAQIRYIQMRHHNALPA